MGVVNTSGNWLRTGTTGNPLELTGMAQALHLALADASAPGGGGGTSSTGAGVAAPRSVVPPDPQFHSRRVVERRQLSIQLVRCLLGVAIRHLEGMQASALESGESGLGQIDQQAAARIVRRFASDWATLSVSVLGYCENQGLLTDAKVRRRVQRAIEATGQELNARAETQLSMNQPPVSQPSGNLAGTDVAQRPDMRLLQDFQHLDANLRSWASDLAKNNALAKRIDADKAWTPIPLQIAAVPVRSQADRNAVLGSDLCQPVGSAAVQAQLGFAADGVTPRMPVPLRDADPETGRALKRITVQGMLNNMLVHGEPVRGVRHFLDGLQPRFKALAWAGRNGERPAGIDEAIVPSALWTSWHDLVKAASLASPTAASLANSGVESDVQAQMVRLRTVLSRLAKGKNDAVFEVVDLLQRITANPDKLQYVVNVLSTHEMRRLGQLCKLDHSSPSTLEEALFCEGSDQPHCAALFQQLRRLFLMAEPWPASDDAGVLDQSLADELIDDVLRMDIFSAVDGNEKERAQRDLGREMLKAFKAVREEPKTTVMRREDEFHYAYGGFLLVRYHRLYEELERLEKLDSTHWTSDEKTAHEQSRKQLAKLVRRLRQQISSRLRHMPVEQDSVQIGRLGYVDFMRPQGDVASVGMPAQPLVPQQGGGDGGGISGFATTGGGTSRDQGIVNSAPCSAFDPATDKSVARGLPVSTFTQIETAQADEGSVQGAIVSPQSTSMSPTPGGTLSPLGSMLFEAPLMRSIEPGLKTWLQSSDGATEYVIPLDTLSALFSEFQRDADQYIGRSVSVDSILSALVSQHASSPVLQSELVTAMPKQVKGHLLSVRSSRSKDRGRDARGYKTHRDYQKRDQQTIADPSAHTPAKPGFPPQPAAGAEANTKQTESAQSKPADAADVQHPSAVNPQRQSARPDPSGSMDVLQSSAVDPHDPLARPDDVSWISAFMLALIEVLEDCARSVDSQAPGTSQQSDFIAVIESARWEQHDGTWCIVLRKPSRS